MFLTMMIEHHEGAVTMSETVLDEGENPEVAELADEIIAVQEQEIDLMHEMLGHEPDIEDDDHSDH
jgi:uncharacterized protein (DUF305 family)